MIMIVGPVRLLSVIPAKWSGVDCRRLKLNAPEHFPLT